MSFKYSDVMSGKVKAEKVGGMTITRFVSWDGAPVLTVRHDFHTIGPTTVMVAPKLPTGFRMEAHSSWERLRDLILKGSKTATFAELDLISVDLHLLQKLTGPWGGDDFNPLYDDRPDWADWAAAFEDLWSDLEYDIEALFRRAVPHLPPHSSHEELEKHIAEHGLDCQPIGNRVDAPSLVEALRAMLAVAETEARQVAS